jgi:DNA-directed RNA polymerase subunit alpha
MTNFFYLSDKVEKNKEHYSCFLIEPLNKGQSITLGNALRRTLLSQLTSYSIVAATINDLETEFEQINFIKEETLEVLQAFQEIFFKESFNYSKKKCKVLYGIIKVKGPLVLTAGFIYIPSHKIEIVNKQQYICTICKKFDIIILVKIQKGSVYELSSKNAIFTYHRNFLKTAPFFNPIKRAAYKTRLILDKKGIIRESLIFELITNGSLTPKRAIQDSLKMLLQLFYPVLDLSFLKKVSFKLLFKPTKKKRLRNFFVGAKIL